jgi:hypothetical protein
MNKLFISALVAAFAVSAAPAFAANTCSLLKPNEATKFLGTAVSIVKPGNDDGTLDCRYSNASKNENVYITVDRGSDVAQQMAMLAMAHTPAVSGVGTKAYYQAGTLFAQKGHTLVSVAIYKGPQSLQTMDPQLTALARLVLSRL